MGWSALVRKNGIFRLALRQRVSGVDATAAEGSLVHGQAPKEAYGKRRPTQDKQETMEI